MSGCPGYRPDPSFQIGAGPTGGVDCTAHACSNVIDGCTCGAKDPGGRLIRLQTNEPVPDVRSPGLNLNQVAEVALLHYGVYLEVRHGSRSVTFEEYERRRKDGQPAIGQLDYATIADSRYDAGRGFRGGHAISENHQATYDPLADGRAMGVFRFDGKLYERSVMRTAFGRLIIASSSTGVTRVGAGRVWAAFGRDVVPDYIARVPGPTYLAYAVDERGAGKVLYRRRRETSVGFMGYCTPPRSFAWPVIGNPERRVTLVKFLTGSRAGKYVSAKYAAEVGGNVTTIRAVAAINRQVERTAGFDEIDPDVRNDPVAA